MKVLIQWATSVPTDWVEYDIQSVGDARRLPRKPPPTGGESLDNKQGWIAGINIQGIVFTGDDHIGFEVVNGALIVTCWNDDPDDFPVGTRWGKKWTLGIPKADPKLSGAVNTVQSVQFYGEPNSVPVQMNYPAVLPYSELTFPPANQTLHGVWLDDAQWAAHISKQSAHGWREWIV